MSISILSNSKLPIGVPFAHFKHLFLVCQIIVLNLLLLLHHLPLILLTFQVGDPPGLQVVLELFPLLLSLTFVIRGKVVIESFVFCHVVVRVGICVVDQIPGVDFSGLVTA